jgi:uncharacterized protein YkwD
VFNSTKDWWMRKTTITLCLATLSVLVACGGGSDGPLPADPITGGSDSPANPTANPPASSAVTAANSCDLPNFQNEVFAAVNAARAQARTCGNTSVPAAAAVRWNEPLFAASAGHSADMATHNNLDHTGSDGKDFPYRAAQQGYNSVYGENIAVGYDSVQSVIKGWLDSPDHCSIMMNKNINDMAVACVRSSNSRPYWTMVVGKT